MLPVYIARNGNVYRVVLPNANNSIVWGGLWQTTVGAPATAAGNSTDSLPEPDANLPSTGSTAALRRLQASVDSVYPLAGDGTVSSTTTTGGETTTIALPPVTGAYIEADSGAGAAALGALTTLTVVVAVAALSML